MRHLRPFLVLVAAAMLGAACTSSSPGASTGGNQSQAAQSQGSTASQGAGASQGGTASQPAASSGGGGGGGGGANGSIHYEITGDATKSGDLDFYANASQFGNGGWVAYFYNSTQDIVIQINSNPAGQSATYGDGEILIVGSKDASCTFNYSRNDSGGLKGTIDCPSPVASNTNSGVQIHVQFHATVDAHT